jgi:hypothetical protein
MRRKHRPRPPSISATCQRFSTVACELTGLPPPMRQPGARPKGCRRAACCRLISVRHYCHDATAAAARLAAAPARLVDLTATHLAAQYLGHQAGQPDVVADDTVRRSGVAGVELLHYFRAIAGPSFRRRLFGKEDTDLTPLRAATTAPVLAG